MKITTKGSDLTTDTKIKINSLKHKKAETWNL